jgi:hypothetical protein
VNLTPGESLLHHARSVLFSLEKNAGGAQLEYAGGVRDVRVRQYFSHRPVPAGSRRVHFRNIHEVKIDLEDASTRVEPSSADESAADLGIYNTTNPVRAIYELWLIKLTNVIVPETTRCFAYSAIKFEETHWLTRLGCVPTSSTCIRRAAASWANYQVRIHVPQVWTPCRMIQNGLGCGQCLSVPLSTA